MACEVLRCTARHASAPKPRDPSAPVIHAHHHHQHWPVIASPSAGGQFTWKLPVGCHSFELSTLDTAHAMDPLCCSIACQSDSTTAPFAPATTMASGSSAASIAQERDAHSEPINFRAALAAFEQNSSTHAGSPGAAAGRTPQTPARPSGGLDPIARSASTPHNRAGAASNNPFSAANAAASPRVATGSIPATSASGMLSAPSPAVVASTSPSYATGSTLRKSDSG